MLIVEKCKIKKMQTCFEKSGRVLQITEGSLSPGYLKKIRFKLEGTWEQRMRLE